MREFMIIARFGHEVEAIRSYGFLERHAVKAFKHDNPKAIVLEVCEII